MKPVVPLLGAGLLALVFASSEAPMAPQRGLLVHSVARYLSRSKFRGFSPSYDDAQDLVEAVKLGDPTAIRDAANLMAVHPGLRGFDGYVVPVPRSSEDRPSMEALADALVVRGVGSSSLRAVWRGTPVASSRMLRRAGRPAVQPDAHLESFHVSPGLIPPDAPVLFVDDMLTAGNTMLGLMSALRRHSHRGPILGATVGSWVESPEGLPQDAFFPLTQNISSTTASPISSDPSSM